MKGNILKKIFKKNRKNRENELAKSPRIVQIGSYWQETAVKVRSRTETFKNGPGVRKQLQLAESGRNRMRTDASARKQT